MPESKTAVGLFISACALASACLLSQNTSARAQAPAGQSMKQAGAPLKGVDVKLGRYAGAQFGSGGMSIVAGTTTDEEGKFKLPVVPAGKYVLILEPPKVPKDAAGARAAGGLQGQISVPDAPPEARAYVTLNLPGNKRVEKGYDFARKKAFDPPVLDRNEQSASRLKEQLADLVYESDGATPCEGAINASRSNIKNTFE